MLPTNDRLPDRDEVKAIGPCKSDHHLGVIDGSADHVGLENSNGASVFNVPSSTLIPPPVPRDVLLGVGLRLAGVLVLGFVLFDEYCAVVLSTALPTAKTIKQLSLVVVPPVGKVLRCR